MLVLLFELLVSGFQLAELILCICAELFVLLHLTLHVCNLLVLDLSLLLGLL